MKTREQLRNEDASRCVVKYRTMLIRLSVDDKDRVLKFLRQTTLAVMELPNDRVVMEVAGRVLAEFGDDLATLQTRLDEAVIAEGFAHYGKIGDDN